jgi:hypothetical protein
MVEVCELIKVEESESGNKTYVHKLRDFPHFGEKRVHDNERLDLNICVVLSDDSVSWFQGEEQMNGLCLWARIQYY